jgi:RNA polymerase sigma-70 factor (ECF subfamily)
VHDSRRASDEGHRGALRGARAHRRGGLAPSDAGEVRAALGTLPADQLKVIELAYFGGFTHTEIADMLETPLGTVKGRMRLGLEKLRGVLGEGAAEVWT